MKNKKSIITMWVLAFISPIMFLAAYSYLPEKVPIHWNAQGQVDNYGSKAMAAFLFFLPILLALMFQFLPKIDPKKQNYVKFQKYYDIFAIFFTAFFVVVNGVMLTETLRPGTLSIGLIISIGVSLMLIVLGNMMGKIKHNYFMGIKTPWTLADPDVWNKTHRVGGIMWVVIGILALITSFISTIAFAVVILAGALGSTVVLFILSYVWFKKAHPDGDTDKK